MAHASKKTILFTNSTRYKEFTNFSSPDVTYKGKRYPTGEHLYQALKFMDDHPEIAERIRKCGDEPNSAYKAGQVQYKKWVRSDWDRVKVKKMEVVLRLKFTQHAHLKAELLGTGDAELVLNSTRNFWGMGTSSSSHNELGKALMRLRKELAMEAVKNCTNGCILCGKSAENEHFCSPACTSKAKRNAPLLIEVGNTHRIFKTVSDQFKASWQHPTGCPTVRRVYKIIEHPSCIAKYEAYRKSVETRGKFAASGRPAGNETRLWHGTTRKCLLGDSGNSTLCSSTSCPLCGIIRESYSLDLFGKKTGWGRFGKGIYTSSTSSKSNDYSKNVKHSKQKAILLNKVVVGKEYKAIHNHRAFDEPPKGYDSVHGVPSSRGALNYDEYVCYAENAIRPSHLVIYDS